MRAQISSMRDIFLLLDRPKAFSNISCFCLWIPTMFSPTESFTMNWWQRLSSGRGSDSGSHTGPLLLGSRLGPWGRCARRLWGLVPPLWLRVTEARLMGCQVYLSGTPWWTEPASSGSVPSRRRILKNILPEWDPAVERGSVLTWETTGLLLLLTSLHSQSRLDRSSTLELFLQFSEMLPSSSSSSWGNPTSSLALR